MFLIKIITSTGISLLYYHTLRAAYSCFMRNIASHALTTRSNTIILKRASDRLVLHSNISSLIGTYDENGVLESRTDA